MVDKVLDNGEIMNNGYGLSLLIYMQSFLQVNIIVQALQQKKE